MPGDFAIYEADDHERIAGEKFGAGEDDHDEATRENEALDELGEAKSTGVSEEVHAGDGADEGGKGDHEAGEEP